jgi:hypothetical protein
MPTIFSTSLRVESAVINARRAHLCGWQFITKPEPRRLLGFGTRYRLDRFLKSHDVYEDYTMEDFEQDRDALKQLGF